MPCTTLRTNLSIILRSLYNVSTYILHSTGLALLFQPVSGHEGEKEMNTVLFRAPVTREQPSCMWYSLDKLVSGEANKLLLGDWCDVNGS